LGQAAGFAAAYGLLAGLGGAAAADDDLQPRLGVLAF
jgi:hypothetical protein